MLKGAANVLNEKLYPNHGLFWHVHHEMLWEYCWNYAERVANIVHFKADSEKILRLKLMNRIKAAVGDQKKLKAFEKAKIAEYETSLKMRKLKSYGKAWKLLEKKLARQGKARHEAWKNFESTVPSKAKMEQLHALECPNCPWNGQTIFPPHPATPVKAV